MDTELNRIYNQVNNELLTFQNELNRLSVPTYPSTLYTEVIDHLNEKLNKYKDALEKISLDFRDDDKKIVEQAKNKLITKIHNPLVIQETKFLNWLSKAQTRKVPWSFIPCIEELASKILPGNKLIICCENQYNYGICWSLSKKTAPYPYHVLSLPNLHRVNVLWHVLIGHELFHPRCEKFIAKHNKSVLKKITAKVKKKPETFLPKDEDLGNLFIEQIKDQYLVNVSKIIHRAWRRALEELLSDMGCVKLFGPSGIMAMIAFSSCSDRSEIPDPKNNFYPSWLYRLQTCWKYFIKKEVLQKIVKDVNEKYPQVAKSFNQQIKAIENLIIETKDETTQNPYAKIAYEEVEALLPKAARFIENSIPKDMVTWQDEEVIKQVPDLLGRLKNGIPPNEIITKVDESKEEYKTIVAEFPAIFLAGWIYETYWQEEKDKTMYYKTMSKLLLKAFEDTRVIKKIQKCPS